MSMATFGDGLSSSSVIWTALLIAAYALLVNAFYQILSKRVMFASKRERKTEQELKEAMEAAEVARKEADQAVAVAVEESHPAIEQAQVAAAAAADTEQAVAKAQVVIETQAKWGLRSMTRSGAYFALVPLVIFTFFLLLSGALIFLTNGQRNVTEVLSLSIAVILAVRITAYISEPTSHDIAKMLPLALLGFFLLEGGFADAAAGFEQVQELRSQAWRVFGFLTLIVGVEFSLHVLDYVIRRVRHSKWLESQKEIFESN